jgi:ADP-heptose:LPS heptosyltransferase
MIDLRTRMMKLADATLGAGLCALLGLIDYLRDGTNDARPPGAIERILVIRPGGVGDMILLQPVLQILHRRYPEALVDLVSEKRNADILRLSGEATPLLYDRNPVAFLASLLRRRYDVAVDTEQFHNFSAVFAYLSGAPCRIGFKINPRRNPLYTHLVTYALDGAEAEQFLRLLAPLGVDTAGVQVAGSMADTGARLPHPLADELNAYCGGRRLAVLHAGASTPYKHWDAERFASLAERLERNCEMAVVLIGSKTDGGQVRRVLAARRSPRPWLSLAGRTGLMETGALLQRAALFVGGDSGLAHLAVAVDTPTVVLFGPSDRRKWGHCGTGHAVVSNERPCAPCAMFGYHKPCRTIACMQSIDVEQVASACLRVMQERGTLTETASRAATPPAASGSPPGGNGCS